MASDLFIRPANAVKKLAVASLVPCKVGSLGLLIGGCGIGPTGRFGLDGGVSGSQYKFVREAVRALKSRCFD